MKANPAQVAQNMVAKPKFIFKENSIVPTKQPIIVQEPITKPVIQETPYVPKQLSLQFDEIKPQQIQPKSKIKTQKKKVNKKYLGGILNNRFDNWKNANN